MANVKISEMEEASQIISDDYVPIVQQGVNKRAKIGLIKDMIVESGSNDNGKWIKYADGTMIVTQEFTKVVSITEKAGSMYYASLYDIPLYPEYFTEVYSVNVTAYNNNIFSVLPYSNDKTTGSHLDQSCTRLMIYAPEVYQNETILFNVTAIGRWK